MNDKLSAHTRNIRLIGITGGIGSGKSVVSRMLRLMGYFVYDCDFEAKRIMDHDNEIIDLIAREISPEAIKGKGRDRYIDRRILAETLFTDEKRRLRLNEVVHAAVRDDLLRTALKADNDKSPVFVESAILASSRLASLCDMIWSVETPDIRLRIDRIISRCGCSETDALARIRAQEKEDDMLRSYTVRHINNISGMPLMPQLAELLRLNYCQQSN